MLAKLMRLMFEFKNSFIFVYFPIKENKSFNMNRFLIYLFKCIPLNFLFGEINDIAFDFKNKLKFVYFL